MNTLVGSRAHYLKAARAFFDARGYLEVDTSALSPYANIDTFIDPIETTSPQGFLHTSPEYAMKRLLANGSGDIYFLGHVFRQEYPSPRHSPEFTMVEWYKTETDEGTFLAEVHDFLTLFLGPLPLTTQTYEEAYHTFAKPIETDPSWTFEERRHYIWGTLVEPNLGETGLHLITHFPKEDAALAQTAIVGGKEVAKRYEYYYRGIELANGFLELTDPIEQRARFTEANAKRVALGKAPLPIDPHFLAALEKGLPPATYGIAAGFDRLFALAHNSPSLIDLLR